MNIPYTVEERPDTGLANGKLGIWLFLASEVMLFGALFSTYIILRVGAPEWPHGELNVWLGMANTFILIGSSVTMVMAWASLKLNLVIGIAAWSLGLFQIPFIINFFASIKWGKAVGINPWDATTLEWSAPSPPGHGNFLTEPIVYRGPYEYSVPGAARDFTPTFEPEKA